MRAILLGVLVLLASAAPCAGQVAEDSQRATPLARSLDVSEEAARLLNSEVSSERAWGAYLAGLHGLREQAEALRAVLERESSGGWEDSLVQRAALDALIRLDAEVSAETLRAHLRDSTDEAIILLARDPVKNSAALLELFEEQTPAARWLAAGNLLLEAKARGFAPRLLSELKIHARVWVYDGEAGGHGGNGGYGCGSGGGSYHAPEGFPPVGFYTLTSEPTRGAVVVAPGPRTVYYVRSLVPNHCPECDCDAPAERDARRLEYLAGLLGGAADWLGFESRPSFDIVCRNTKECRAELANLRRQIEQPYAALVERLVAEGHLTAAEAETLPPDITFLLSDVREDKSSPLPTTLRGVKLSVEE